jgi:hypothetical protein
MNRFFALSCLLLTIACSPIGPLPGGELSGTVQVTPENWAAAQKLQIVQIETRPTNPYSINIWAVSDKTNFYIGSGGGEDSAWVGHLAQDPSVRLRLGDEIYLLTAVRVIDATEQARVSTLYAEKYEEFDAEGFVAEEPVVFRLDPR